MIFKAVSYKNLKARTECIDLSKATLIVGRNFTGKTTIPDAIKLALLAYLPGMDKTAKAIFSLSSGDEMNAMVETDNGAQIARVWRRAGGTISRKDFIPMGWPETPVVLLDANAYFGASDRGKADILFRATSSSAPLDPIVAKTNEIILGDNDIFNDKFKAYIKGKPAQEVIIDMLVNVEAARSTAAANERRFAGTMQGLATLAAKDAVPLDEDAMATLKRKRSELEAAEGKLSDAKRLQQLHEQTHTPTEAKLDDLKNKSAELGRSIQAKDVEIGKAERFWEDLLRHDDCPMCGTSGKTWRLSAQEKREKSQATLNTEMTDLKREKFNTDEAIKGLTAKVAGAVKRLTEADRKKVEDCEEIVAEIREEVGQAEKALETYAQDQSDRRRLAEARQSHQDAKDSAKRLQDAKTYLLAEKARMAEGLFEPILKAAHAFTDGITLGPLQFQDGVLGMARMLGKHGPVFVAHSAFSGTEQAVVFAALQGALAAGAPVKLVVMDELGRIDEPNKAQLLRNVLKALDTGVIDQFIGIDTSAPKDTTGFTIVERT